jgi:hypothetical protein
MTLKSNADNNRAQARAKLPSNPGTSSIPIPGPSARPSIFKSASYVSSSNLKSDATSSVGKSSGGERETSEQRKIRKLREKEEGIGKQREKDPEKEREREKRRVERRAARVTQAGPEIEVKAGDGSTSESNVTEKMK